MRKMSNIEDVTNSPQDWEDFWYNEMKEITYEQYQAAQQLIKDYERQCNLKEQAFSDARSKIDVEYSQVEIEANSPYNDGWTQRHYENQLKELEIIRQQGGYEWTPGT